MRLRGREDGAQSFPVQDRDEEAVPAEGRSWFRSALGGALSVSALVLGGFSVVLSIASSGFVVGSGAAALAVAAAAGIVDPRSTSAPAAFLVCAVMFVGALALRWSVA